MGKPDSVNINYRFSGWTIDYNVDGFSNDESNATWLYKAEAWWMPDKITPISHPEHEARFFNTLREAMEFIEGESGVKYE